MYQKYLFTQPLFYAITFPYSLNNSFKKIKMANSNQSTKSYKEYKTKRRENTNPWTYKGWD